MSVNNDSGGFAVYAIQGEYFLIKHSGGVVTSLDSLPEAPADTGRPTALTDSAANQLRAYFGGALRSFDFPFSAEGTDFQKRVWAELCRIPYGETRSYGEIAAAVGSPNACRAVGMACNRNPIAIAVPCHRVVGSDGSLTGYAGGLSLKAALLRLEAENVKVRPAPLKE